MITDGTHICSLCGEFLTGCALCGSAPLIDITSNLAKVMTAEREAERELWRQEQSIKRASWNWQPIQSPSTPPDNPDNEGERE